ncbi:hypothetical protein GCM10009760_38780 [Kitasatospora kazusensis]|uniref:Uncharacterized protein n=1 Tax=Kitasatospora kazusensis TaxID=407974 RepID=A0ABP5LHZ5_9ACTN
MINGADRAHFSSPRTRTLGPEDWTDSGIPLLPAPREFVTELHQRHLPQPGTTVVAVLDACHHVTASASFSPRPHADDGWLHRNAILTQLRRITPHDLRLADPSRTAVLLRCREGSAGWTRQDGAWMWALRDAAALHGLRCGPYIVLTPGGWQSLGDGRHGQLPNSGSWADGPLHTVTELTPRAGREAGEERAWRPAPVTPLEALRPTGTR